MQPLAVGQALDRRHLVTVRLRGEHEARADERAVEQHGARAALPLLARVLRAGKAEALPQHVEQALATPGVGLVALAVDRQRDLHAMHRSSARRASTRERVAPVGSRAAHVVDRAARGGDQLREAVRLRRAAP